MRNKMTNVASYIDWTQLCSTTEIYQSGKSFSNHCNSSLPKTLDDGGKYFKINYSYFSRNVDV